MNRGRAILVLVSALAASSGCARRPDSSDWLAQAETANLEADRLLPSGKVDEARDLLRHAAESRPPAETLEGDARAVRKDLYCRLSTLEVEHGKPEEAVRWATLGLGLGGDEDALTANLQIARGHALERLGDTSSASRDYHDALVITESLLDRSLEGRQTPP